MLQLVLSEDLSNQDDDFILGGIFDEGLMTTSGNQTSVVILSWILVAVTCIVFVFSFWTLRQQIKEMIVKCWTRTRADRSSNQTSTLNDIIFDPEEEQRASLAESLLPNDEDN
ncbi:predicted protein [Chaetoceros tenuissimus]|uniref:Uncharacterized protein n=1 Tax=Chaetoceros tenuissimus TaxID=426638 RepID=A0AAD3D590_9STRA|nr:predicted protein [Chaetoceros tenuissimus]